MNKVWLILWREVSLRLRKPSFWVLTLLVPVALAVLYALPVIAAQHSGEPQTVLVVDETGLFDGRFRSTVDVHFRSMPSMDFAAEHRAENENLVLFIPRYETAMPREATLFFYGYRTPSLAVQSTVDNQLQQLLRNAILEDVYGLSPEERHSVEGSHIRFSTRDVVTGHDGLTRVKTVLSLVLALLMALSLVLFGVQVMRAMQEERQNRVAEVVASSVTPVQLMGGKLGGVALTALLQLVLWLLLTVALAMCIRAAVPEPFEAVRQQVVQADLATKGIAATIQYDSPAAIVDDTVSALTAIDVPLIALQFLLYFLFGFLLYGGLLAALAARLDSDAATLQWTLLVCLPLLIVPLLMPLVLKGSHLLLLLPFTAPAAVMAALPFGVDYSVAIWAPVLLLVAGGAALLLAAYSYRRHIV